MSKEAEVVDGGAKTDHGIPYPQCCAKLCELQANAGNIQALLNRKEKATLLAALSMWYYRSDSSEKAINMLASGEGAFCGLNDNSVDNLCMKLTGKYTSDDYENDTDGEKQEHAKRDGND